MKKTILSLLLIGGSYMVFAQNDSTRRNNTNTYDSTQSMNNATMNGTDSSGINNSNRNNMNNGNMNNMNNGNNMNRDSSLSSSNAYNAYGNTSVNIPYRAQMNLQKDYPSANNISWTQSGDWYHGTYMNNGRYSHIYYNDRGDTYTVSMPVTETYVPDDIISKVSTMYGPTIYDVTTMKGDSGQNIYQIRTLDNGQVKAQWIGDDGSTVMDPFRSDINTNVSTSSNAAMDNGTMDSSSRANMDNNMNNGVNTNVDSSRMNNLNNMDSSGMNNMYNNNMNNMDSSRMGNMNNADSSRMNNDMNMTDSSRMNNNMNNGVNTTDSTGNWNNQNATDSSRMNNTNGNWNNNMDSSRRNNSSDSTVTTDSTGTSSGLHKTQGTKNSKKTSMTNKSGAMKPKEY